MGEALYPWPVMVWFCDYTDRVIGAGRRPVVCPECGQENCSSGVEAAPGFHWEYEDEPANGGL